MDGLNIVQSSGKKEDSSFAKAVSGRKVTRQNPISFAIHCNALQKEEIVAGEAYADWHEYGHDAELEWCLIFPRPLSKLKVSKELVCMLQGTIRERVLYTAGKENEKNRNIPGSRSIIAMNMGKHSGYFSGISTSLADILSDRTKAAMRLEYHKENKQGVVERYVSSSALSHIDLVPSLQKMQRSIIDRKQADVNIVRLHAVNRYGGYIQERWLKYQSALTAARGVHFSDIAHSTIRSRLMSDVIERREYIRRGTEARLHVTDVSGSCVGCSVLKVL